MTDYSELKRLAEDRANMMPSEDDRDLILALIADSERLRAALAEAKYRIEQGRIWAGTKWKLTGLHAHGQQKALDVIDVAMSQGEKPGG